MADIPRLRINDKFCKGTVPLTPGLGVISITFTFVNHFDANLRFRILLSLEKHATLNFSQKFIRSPENRGGKMGLLLLFWKNGAPRLLRVW